MSASTRIAVASLAVCMFAGLAVTVAHGSAGLDPTERRTLLAMREEEKLAHDVYLGLAAASGLGAPRRHVLALPVLAPHHPGRPADEAS